MPIHENYIQVSYSNYISSSWLISKQGSFAEIVSRAILHDFLRCLSCLNCFGSNSISGLDEIEDVSHPAFLDHIIACVIVDIFESVRKL